MNHLHAEFHRQIIEFLFRDELPGLVGGLAREFFILNGAVADVNQALLGKVRDEAGIGAMLQHR